MEVISRSEARERGLKKYFTGKPCQRRGHVAERLVSNTKCVECNTADYAEWAKANGEHLAAYQKRYAVENAAAVARNKQSYRQRNPGKVRATAKQSYEKNREARRVWARLHKKANYKRIAERMRRYSAANRGRLNALAAKYKAAKRRATPPWADLEAIRRIYEAASAAGLEVDHEVPLQGRLVCGLHVENNLRAIPAHVNRRKSSKFEVL